MTEDKGVGPMGLEDYWHLVRRQWPIVLVLAVIGAVIGFLIPHLSPTHYQASAKLAVGAQYPTRSSTDAYNANLLTTQLASSYVSFLNDRTTAEQVIARLHLHRSTASVQSMIAAKAIPNTNIINLSVNSSSPLLAKRVADATAAQFADRINRLQRVGSNAEISVQLAESAALPRSPISPSPRRTALFGGLLGLLLGVGATGVRQRTNKTMTDPRELAAHGPVRLLGVIGRSRAATQRPLRLRDDASAFSEQMRQLRANLVLGPGRPSPSSLLVTSPSAQEGRTTVACALAQVLAEGGRSVVLVDADFRHSGVLGVVAGAADDLSFKGAGLADVLRHDVPLAKALRPWTSSHVHVLPAGRVDGNPGALLSSPEMDRVLAELEAQFDFVVVDGPPVLPVADALLLSQLVQSVIVAVRHRRTRWDDLESAFEQLDGVTATVEGTVVTMAPQQSSSKGYLRRRASLGVGLHSRRSTARRSGARAGVARVSQSEPRPSRTVA